MRTLIYTFLLSTFIFGLKVQAQRILTIGEVYDFDIGDEFHYENHAFGYPPPSGTNKIITNKWLDPLFYTVRYEVKSIHYKPFWVGLSTLEYNVWSTTDTVVYTHLNDSCFTFFQFSFPVDYFYYYDSANTWVCGWQYSPNPMFEPNYYWSIFGEGIGKVDYGEASTSNQEVDGQWLVYYSKTNKTWGKPREVPTSIQDVIVEHIKVFPNPFMDYINVSVAQESGIIRIYNLMGKVVLNVPILSKVNEIDMTKLPRGIYIIKIESDSEMFCKKIIKS